MLTLLRKLFIKDYQNISDPKVHEKHGRLAAAFGIFTNSVLVVLKLVFGIIARSISMIGDSVNNLSDGASSAVALIGFKMSAKPADREHPFGHQRIEYITGLIVSIVVVALGIILGYESVLKIISPTETEYTIVYLVILGVAVLIKIIQAVFNFRIAKLINSVTIKAVGVDSLTDSIATTVLLISSLICYFVDASWTVYLDGIMGVLIAVFIIYSGICMIRQTSSPLIGEAAHMASVEAIIDEIKSYDGVLGIHDMVAHNYGPNKVFMTVHVEVDSRTPLLEAHDLIDSIETDVKEKYRVELTIHMDPVVLDDPEVNRLKEKVGVSLKSINDGLMMHDFRVVKGASRSTLVFDVVIPFELDVKEEYITSELTKLVNKDERTELCLAINYDRPFVE